MTEPITLAGRLTTIAQSMEEAPSPVAPVELDALALRLRELIPEVEALEVGRGEWSASMDKLVADRATSELLKDLRRNLNDVIAGLTSLASTASGALLPSHQREREPGGWRPFEVVAMRLHRATEALGIANRVAKAMGIGPEAEGLMPEMLDQLRAAVCEAAIDVYESEH